LDSSFFFSIFPALLINRSNSSFVIAPDSYRFVNLSIFLFLVNKSNSSFVKAPELYRSNSLSKSAFATVLLGSSSFTTTFF